MIPTKMGQPDGQELALDDLHEIMFATWVDMNYHCKLL